MRRFVVQAAKQQGWEHEHNLQQERMERSLAEQAAAMKHQALENQVWVAS